MVALVVLLIVCMMIIGALAYISRDRIASIGQSSTQILQAIDVKNAAAPKEEEAEIKVQEEEIQKEPAPKEEPKVSKEEEKAPQPAAAQIQDSAEPVEPVSVDAPEVQGAQVDNVEQTSKPSELQNGQVSLQPGNPVVAKVGDKEITRVEVLEFIEQIPQNIKKDATAIEMFPRALSEMVDVMVVSDRADDAKIEQDPKVQEQLALARERIKRSVYLQEQVSAHINDDLLKDAYQKYIDGQTRDEEVRASHILVQTQGQALSIIKQLDEGTSFEVLATSLSLDESAQNGGDLGYFTAEEVVPEFAKAVSSIKVGDYSEQPVQTKFGWHVIKVTDRRIRSPESFEAVRPEIERTLQENVLNGLLKDWRAQADVQIFDINGNKQN